MIRVIDVAKKEIGTRICPGKVASSISKENKKEQMKLLGTSALLLGAKGLTSRNKVRY